MRILFILMLLIFTCALSRAQVNLVLNPSFEQFSICPDHTDEIKFAFHWMDLDSAWSPPDWIHGFDGDPEFLHICGTASGAIPYNGAYYNYPHTGDGMAEVQTYCNPETPGTYVRDYLQGHLKSSLVAGQSYCVSFYVALEQGSSYAINHLGAYFDDGTIDTTHDYEGIHSEVLPQVIESAVMYDTSHMPVPFGTWTWRGNWVRIQGSFIANGSERIITIANFSDSAHTTAIPTYDTTGIGIGYGYTFYLIDDISVIRSDAVAHAGPDRVIPGILTDSVVIGDTLDSYLPTYWYVNGIKIDSNTAWLKVRPDTTTRYVMALQLCSGDVTYDTVTVWVATMGSTPINKYAHVQIYPNPAFENIVVQQGQGSLVILYDVVGREVYKALMGTQSETVNIEMLQAGIYIINIVDPENGYRITQKLVKE